MQIIDYCILYFALAGILCGSLDRELAKLTSESSLKDERIIILCMGSLCTLGLLLAILFWYLQDVKVNKHKGKLSYTDDIFTTRSWKPLVCELFICFWHPFPFLWDYTFLEWDPNFNTHIQHSANDVLLAWAILIRVYIVAWFISGIQYFWTSRA